MTLKPVSAYLFGERIVLETIPVDPRDLFYGDFVYLNLAISEVPKEDLQKDVQQVLEERENEQYTFWGGGSSITVYTILEKQGDTYTAKEISLTKPKSGLYIKGKIPYYWGDTSSSTVKVDYGLDRYYVEENTGKQLELAAQEGAIFVAVKVYNGYALFDELIFP